MGHGVVEFRLVHAVFGARRNGAAGSWAGEPQAMKMTFCQCHGCVKAYDRKQARDMKNGLNDLFAHGWVEVVELRGVIPGEAGAVVAVIDVADFAGGLVATLKDYGSIGLLEVVVFNLDFDASVGGKIRSVETVGRIWRVVARNEPLRMFDNPGRVDAHVVRHHVAGQSDTVAVGAIAKVDVGRFTAQIVGDAIVVKRICRCNGVAVTAKLLDSFRCTAALPYA